MARQPEHLVEQQRSLGRYLAALREAAGLYQVHIARAVPCHRTTVTHAEAGSQLPDADFWEIADRVVGADGALITRYDELIQAKAAHLAQQQAKRRAQARTTVQQLTMAPPPRPHQTPTSEPPVHRRDFVFSTTTAALASTVLPRTVIADEEAAATVHAITTVHRRLEGTTSSHELAEPVAAHL